MFVVCCLFVVVCCLFVVVCCLFVVVVLLFVVLLCIEIIFMFYSSLHISFSLFKQKILQKIWKHGLREEPILILER